MKAQITGIVAVVALFLILLSPGEATGQFVGGKSTPPNIVLILADDLGWMDVGYNGAEFYETPNIDQLASEGMVFTRFYPSAANCAPTRASLLTGMYSPRHQVYVPQGLSRGGDVSKMRFKVPTQGQNSTFNTFPVSINTVSPEFESLAEMLKKSDYVSARLGKWHIGDDNQGFDVLSAAGEIGKITNYCGEEKRYYNDDHVAERLTDAAIHFIEANKEHPFFLYLSHWEVHTPLAARDKRIEYYKSKLKNRPGKNYDPVYAAEVEQVDSSVGRVLAKLNELGLEDNTVVIVTSDNGGLSSVTDNAPLRAGKGTFYEGGLRVPFCIKWPGITQAGSKSDIPVTGVDFMPTFAEIASAELPQNQPVDGDSFVPILKGEPFDRDRSLFFHFPLYLGGSVEVLPSFDGTENYWRAVPSSVIMAGDWKLIYYYEYDRYELFNLRTDISEQDDLSGSETGIAIKLLEKLRNWVLEVNAPVPSVLNR
ncbi:sulfatase [Cyclobacterium salsum]|uniref:sulfatase n=1 Tax=Cyclobacterium salsum TaxID=2666329 RepID=UPI0013911C22|nr:sulfatase [Cyclobacterium salsum]